MSDAKHEDGLLLYKRAFREIFGPDTQIELSPTALDRLITLARAHGQPPHQIADKATNKEKSAAFEWLRSVALDENLIGHNASRLAAIALDEWHRLATGGALLAPASTSEGRTFPICKDHMGADWNQPTLDDSACILCRLFYLEAQEGLLEEWQQRAKRAEDDIKDMQRPLAAQMKRLNTTVANLNGDKDRLHGALERLVNLKQMKTALETQPGDLLSLPGGNVPRQTIGIYILDSHGN